MAQTDITVHGMTCGHCVAAVTEELKTIDGVTDVQIELHEGGDSPVRITSDRELDPVAVNAAVDEAGYDVVVG
ncbi:metal-binding protein [Flexivirga endophytica]|uniref:Metal-binding protein n=1 Tax=Flexivirga endophytica TaxID=1849103 RepID=A0A916T3T4_9MICO|nr:heavy-metal-associated domain-containing protein [Flexivirga endophytica]GGB30837.1 metal-binding protein [Flexivirga endophytica]GHB51752.1 metal-binding protein [Flexivirga endophytica]